MKDPKQDVQAIQLIENELETVVVLRSGRDYETTELVFVNFAVDLAPRGHVMANRANHYDAAFEEYLRRFRMPYVAVDETRRSLLEECSLKSPDYLVSPALGESWLVDIKGRRFPSGGEGQSHYWENWATRDDIESMLRWQDVFGHSVRAMLVFAYQILDARWRWQFERRSRWEYRDESYAYYGVWVEDYKARMTRRSRQWDTVSLRKRDYEEVRFPLGPFMMEVSGGTLATAGESALERREVVA